MNFVDIIGYEVVTVTASVVAVTQSEPYKETVKEVALQVGEKIQETKETINQVKQEVVFKKGK